MAWNTDVFYCRRQCLLMAQCNSAKINSHQLDLNNHSRGGLTANTALQYANRNDLIGIPIREARFYGTATYVPSYAEQLVKNGSEQAYSAVHYTDFVGRSPLVLLRSPLAIGGNAPTGGVEDKPFLYSHSSYFREVPEKYLIDEAGNYIDTNGNKSSTPINNPYYEEYTKKWKAGVTHNQNAENPSIPILVMPK